MDPDKKIAMIRGLVAQVLFHLEPNTDAFASAARELARAVMDLDGWIYAGGSLPSTWRRS